LTSCVQVRPPLSYVPVPAVLCASVRCPRVAVALHLAGARPATLHAGLSGFHATLDATSRISTVVHSASCAITAMRSSLGEGVEQRGFDDYGSSTLLQAPCVSYVLLHQMDGGEATGDGGAATPRRTALGSGGNNDGPPTFLTFAYRPPGVEVCRRLSFCLPGCARIRCCRIRFCHYPACRRPIVMLQIYIFVCNTRS
jgi:hypothetical protein